MFRLPVLLALKELFQIDVAVSDMEHKCFASLDAIDELLAYRLHDLFTWCSLNVHLQMVGGNVDQPTLVLEEGVGIAGLIDEIDRSTILRFEDGSQSH
jgi:hypothetical protein